MEGGWSEVSRRKKTAATKEIISFYTMNFPPGTSAHRIRSACAPLGKLSDVFLVPKKNASGQEFAFVKFQDVKDIAAMEKRLNEVKIDGLELRANREKHPRKPAGAHSNFPLPDRRCLPPLHQSRPPSGFRDGRTFLDASMGPNHRPALQSSPQPPVVKLTSKNNVWIDDRVLVGEVKDFDTLENIQSLLGLKGFGDILCKYLGGLQVIIKFGIDSNARKFMENNELWSHMFNWLEFANKKEFRYERLAWLKITGVPLLAWCEDIFKTIAKKYGKVCVHTNSLEACSDLSYGKVAIITCMRKKINEEFTGEMNGKLFKIGVCEIEEDWYPFKPFTTFQYVESEDKDDDEVGDDDDDDVDEDDEDNDVDLEGISATVEMINGGLEDGEIPSGEPPGEAPMTNAVIEESVVGESEEPLANNYLGTPIDGINVACLPNARAQEDTAFCGGQQFNKNSGLNIWAGPNSEIVPTVPLRNEEPRPQLEENARVIRRKVNRTHGRFNPYGVSSSTSNQIPPHPVTKNPTSNSNPTPSIDLNKNASCSDESSSSSTNEMDATTLVGKSIGFQVEAECEALRYAVNGDGDIIGPQ
ncbi:hypothetical protein L2E82_38722 [Cichorium intybus]|uniref:Uncharacterized protein n=1 Tax=Cichorium intybus TaxID=13427 RepID=A0ACB9AFU9_CICIN|nr:hypothetical protein L2E82_38722 [Cichorium intybus]